MDDYGRAAQPPQRSLFPVNMAPEYPQGYQGTTGAFQNAHMAPQPDYVVSRGQLEGYGQVPRSEYETYTGTAAGRGATLQSPSQGQFASQQGLQGSGAYRDPRTGQTIYPPVPAGRGFDHASAHLNPADGRRRQ